ncbi:MAG: glutathione transferase GstA [Burkholderiales bacterium]|nr:glutathione transferase GstA [Burkholderiales bacterium]
MRLYFAPGACSLAVRIALTEAGLPFTAEKVDLRTHKLADGTDYTAINPKGYVPLLELPDGTRLSEVPVLLQYVADRVPGALAPAYGSVDRYRVMEWLNFIATEIHKQAGPLWYPTTPVATKEAARARLAVRFDHVAKALAAQPYLTGTGFGIADAYLFTILNWAPMLEVDLTPFPALVAYRARVAARPAVRRALAAEGLAEDEAAAAPAV